MEFTDVYGNINMPLIMTILLFVGVPVFIASRYINLWYWKIDDFQKGQQEQIRLLKKIAGEKEEDTD